MAMGLKKNYNIFWTSNWWGTAMLYLVHHETELAHYSQVPPRSCLIPKSNPLPVPISVPNFQIAAFQSFPPEACLMSAVVVHWMSKEWHPANNPRETQWTYNGYPTNTHKDNPSDNPVEIQWTSNEQSASNQSGGQSGEHLADILWIFGGHCWTYGGHLASFWQIQGFGIWKQVGNGTGFGTGTGTGRDLGMMIRYGLSVYLLKFTF